MTKVVGTPEPEDARRATRYLLKNVLIELGKAGQKDAVLQACSRVRSELNRIDQGKSIQSNSLTSVAPLALKILEDVLKSIDPD